MLNYSFTSVSSLYSFVKDNSYYIKTLSAKDGVSNHKAPTNEMSLKLPQFAFSKFIKKYYQSKLSQRCFELSQNTIS